MRRAGRRAIWCDARWPCLPERQREVLHLKDIEGYPTREIAEIAACDEAQVRVILSRARNGLREVLKKMMDDERAGRKN